MGLQYFTGGGLGRMTEAAGTRIRRALGGVPGVFTHLVNIRVTTAATAHTLTVMRAASRTTAASTLAAAGTALVCSAALTDGAGNAPAANDILAVILDNGDWHLSTISAWDAGTKTATLNTAIPAGRSVAAGAKIAFYGVQGDTMHANYTYALAAGATNQIPAITVDGCSLVRSAAITEPLVIDIDNATNASTIEHVLYGGTKT